MGKQAQKGGDGSTNVQAAGSVTINTGVTVAEVREIALDVFKANFLEMSGEAQDIARNRAEQITTEFLSKLEQSNPTGIGQATDPSFQHALFTVQTEYARTGDDDLGSLLVDLLVDRSKHDSRTILQIVLNESLAIAPKLTQGQIDVLSIIFLLRYTKNDGLGNLGLFLSHLDKHVEPFTENLESGATAYQHLEYAGCGTSGIGSISLGNILTKTYGGLFSKGFDADDLDSIEGDIPVSDELFIPCLHDSSRLQFNALNESTLDDRVAELDLEDQSVAALKKLYRTAMMSEDAIREYIEGERAYMKPVFEAWSGHMCRFSLTSVGIAIGHANIKRIAGEFTDLSIWIK